MIPYGKQYIDDDDIQSVIKTLKSDFLTQGPTVPLFEQKISEYCESKHAIACNSATSALHISCIALGLCKDDYLWTSPISYVASSNAGLYCGAKIDFVDIDPETFNICIDSLETKLKEADKQGKLPKIVMPVHLCGQPSQMKDIHKLSKKYNFKIIEDASHAIGSEYENKKTGNCDYSDICVFSFHPVKIITTAEGGMATTNSDQLAESLKKLRTHGVTKDPEKMENEPHGSWYYEQQLLGYNYRLTDIQAALGISQLNKLHQFIKSRNKLAHKYDEQLDKNFIKIPTVRDNVKSSFHLYVIRTIGEEKRITRDKLFKYLKSKNILVNIHYMPIYMQPYYQRFNFNYEDFPNSNDYYSSAISIPIFPSLAEDDHSYIVDSVNNFFK